MSELICEMRMTRFSVVLIREIAMTFGDASSHSGHENGGRRMAHNNKLSIAFFSAEYHVSVCAMSESITARSYNIGRRFSSALQMGSTPYWGIGKRDCLGGLD